MALPPVLAMGQADVVAVEQVDRQPGQRAQGLDRIGRLAPFQQFRRADHDARHLGDLHRHHRGIHHGADVDGAVDVVGDEVRLALVQQPVHRDLRIAAQVVGHRLHQLALAEGVRHHHAQQALRGLAGAAQVVFQACQSCSRSRALS